MASQACFGALTLAAFAVAGAIPAAAAPPWTGFYIGVQAGALGSHETRNTATPLAEIFSHSGAGWLGGFQAGFDYQFAPSGLIGIEGLISDASLRKTSPSVVFPPAGYRTDVDSLSTLTARLGYLSGPWLAYARGGFATSRVTFIGTTPGDYVSVGGMRNGWTLGGGVEYMVKSHFSIALEYAHHEFGIHHYLARTVGGLPLDSRVAFSLDSVMVRANLRFSH